MVKKSIALVAFLLAMSVSSVYASEHTSQTSAKLRLHKSKELGTSDMRVLALQNVFRKYNSPLVSYSRHYVHYADLNGIDWKLLPAISGIESTFGRHHIAGTHNVYGWGGGYIYFENWEKGIEHISKALKENYINRGADTIYKIGPIYAPPSQTWAWKVSYFASEINQEYLKISSEKQTLTL